MAYKGKWLILLLLTFLLSACMEPYYRGVPDSQWQQLTGEQKSLIIDQAYNNDIVQAPAASGGTWTANTPIGTFNSPRENSHDALMPVLHPTQTVLTHTNAPATLVWQTGAIHAGMINHPVFYGADSRSYSKAQQVVFMTSLQQALKEQQAFRDVTLAVKAPSTVTKPVITVYFKSTRVADGTEGNQITLDTVLRIDAPNQPIFTRTYLVSGIPDISFAQQEKAVSTALLDKILLGIDEWAVNAQHTK
ncbi:MAG: hypothetical protein K0R48_1111 [Gammaproteobacteria bacterium]|jgi:hypothetical protein|nr:hypothetical protein [Gammaproteobacteria bacterium]